jgi:hypothetical protein
MNDSETLFIVIERGELLNNPITDWALTCD